MSQGGIPESLSARVTVSELEYVHYHNFSYTLHRVHSRLGSIRELSTPYLPVFQDPSDRTTALNDRHPSTSPSHPSH